MEAELPPQLYRRATDSSLERCRCRSSDVPSWADPLAIRSRGRGIGGERALTMNHWSVKRTLPPLRGHHWVLRGSLPGSE
jgi:hypothetical protein